jgi:hypothetical protein
MAELKVGDLVTHPGVDYVMRITEIGPRQYRPDPAMWAKCQWDDGTQTHGREFKLSGLEIAVRQSGRND